MSGELRIRILGIDSVIHHFERATAEFRDMRPLMRRMHQQFERDMEEVWNKGQESWADWSPAYARWRASPAGYSEAPFGEMLDLTGRLRESLTSQTGDSVVIINRRSITFGTDVPYAGYVKEGGSVGGRFGPPRKSSWDGHSDPYRLPRDYTNMLTEAMKARWRRITEDYAKRALS